VVLDLNRCLVFTARIGTDLQIVCELVFELLDISILYEQESGLNSGLLLPGLDRTIRSESLQHATEHMNSYEYKYTLALVYARTYIHHIHTCIQLTYMYTHMHIHTLTYIHTFVHMLTLTNTQSTA